MLVNKEYEVLVNRKSNAQSEKNTCEHRIENYDYLLQRLRTARNNIRECKSLFANLIREQYFIEQSECEWKGYKQRVFEGKLEDISAENQHYYQHTIDRIHDSLNDEITRIKNLRAQEYGMLGNIVSLINSLSNEINNFFN